MTLATFFKPLASLIVGILSLGGYTVAPTEGITVGSAQSFNPVGSTQFTLAGSGITSSQTTITLSSFKTPGGLNLVMTNFGTIGYGALDPQSNSKLENISFTGINQNANGTAVLTGVTRGMDFVYPYQASTTLQKSHAGGSTFILTNTAAFYGTQFGFLANDQTWAGLNTFATSPLVFTPATSTDQLATIGYANSVIAGGAATSTFTVGGKILLATGAQGAAGTYTLNAPRALSTAISTSTPSRAFNNQVPVTMTNDGLANTLNPLLIATSSSYWWANTALFTASTTLASQSQLASTTIQTSLFTIPPTGAISRLLLATTTSTTITGINATTTLLTLSIPANSLYSNGSNGIIKVKLNLGGALFVRDVQPGIYLELSYGGTSIILATSTTKSVNTTFDGGDITFELYGSNATNAQQMRAGMNLINVVGLPTFNFATTTTRNSAVDSTVAQTLTIQGSIGSVSSSMFRVINAEVFLER